MTPPPNNQNAHESEEPAPPINNVAEIFRTFLKLGLTSFGGPVAHLGYMRREFVVRRAWLNETDFAQLVAVCQFLPGPASSQLGFAIGLLRGGWLGAIAAFLAFTLPSALLMFAFSAIGPIAGLQGWTSAMHGLKLTAVVVVAHALVYMVRQLTPDLPRILIAIGALALMVTVRSPWVQLIALLLGGIAGSWLCRHVRQLKASKISIGYGRRVAATFFALFATGLGASALFPSYTTPTFPGVVSAFYQAGALVFGGGHVVLPLLQQSVVSSGWLSSDTFLSGYGAAQAMPGPMFSLAAFLGAEVPLNQPPIVGSISALISIFLPGFLLLLAILPYWAQVARHHKSSNAIAGVNAAVVGMVAAAFYDPVLVEGVDSLPNICIAVIGFVLLASGRVSSLWIVLWCAAASSVASLMIS